MPVILIDDGAGGVELAWYTPVGARPIEEAPVEERARAEAALSALAANRQYLALAPRSRSRSNG